ncbi:ThiF family adenylyltransferase [Sphingobacterium rhinopitheci]|uniref:ThiF family adenylyltransferase n=1 Tax=Sphingobacterium rhinopitheci TaxID=2781960 RepID=UPI001F51F198|nr:ThiF family adenylyltransferase [Sphingobacterium rhinopitheci]MCI0921324.1 ThiF family adenylyltransferase [Sphingobacterium rhinopitheci]
MITSFKPIIFRLDNLIDFNSLNDLKISNSDMAIYDTIEDQLVDLYKVRNPDKSTIDKSEYEDFIHNELLGRSLAYYGAWVYYPWANRLVHLLDEQEFFEVRTNRNNNKISPEEQAILKDRSVGIIGLSVGQSVALTIAMERVCGKLRLADFDTIELSNLNRIRTSVHNLGLSKVIVVAREIAEIDPYLEVEVFMEGLNASNMKDFFLKDGQLDVLIELCDSLDMKLSSRLLAREYQIPVVMETNDRCMVDIERFDVEGTRGILHGLISETELANLNDLSPEAKLQLILKIVDKDRLSPKMIEAFSQMGKTIRSWPQLASSVTMGGGITTDIVRRILLGEKCISGRWYFDVEDILNTDPIEFIN